MNHLSSGNDVNIYGNVLHEILVQNHLSISMLSHLLDFSSRNTVQRIILGQSKHRALETFHRQLMAHRQDLHWSDYDISRLVDAYDVETFGKQGHKLRCSMGELLAGALQESRCSCSMAANPEQLGCSLYTVLSNTEACSCVEVYLYGGESSPLFAALRALLAKHRAGDCAVKIVHLLKDGHDAYTQTLHFLQIRGLFADPRYQCYQLDEEASLAPECGYLLVCKTKTDGTQRVDRIDLIDGQSFACCTDIPDEGGKLRRYYAELFAAYSANMLPLSPFQQNRTQSFGDVVAMHRTFAAVEKCWSQILIKPDFSMAQIAPEVIGRLFARSEHFRAASSEAERAEFMGIQQKRYDNFVTSTHGYTLISTESGIRQYLKTGYLSDHIAGLPPFLPEERYAIVAELARMAEGKQGFRLFLMRDDSRYARLMLNLFDKKVLYLVDASEEDRHTDLVYQSQSTQVIETLREYILKEYLPAHTCGIAESLERVWNILRLER